MQNTQKWKSEQFRFQQLTLIKYIQQYFVFREHCGIWRVFIATSALVGVSFSRAENFSFLHFVSEIFFFPHRWWLFVDPLDYSLEIVYLMVRNTFLGKTKWLQNSLYFKKADWNPLIIRPLLCKRLCNCLPAYNTRQSTNVMFNLIVNCFRWGGKYREWVISGCWWTYLGACLSPCWSYHGYPH